MAILRADADLSDGTRRAPPPAMDDEPSELFKATSKRIRAWEIADGNSDPAAVEKAFYQTLPGLSGRLRSELYTPSNSGVTLGMGHDLGQSTPKEIDDYYGPDQNPRTMFPKPAIFSESQRNVLKQFAGKKVVHFTKGNAAFKATQSISLTYKEATQVFEEQLLVQKGISPARAAFPGFDNLPLLQQEAIVDRVYNRGPGVSKREIKLGGDKMLADLKSAVFNLQTKEVYLVLKRMEGLHKKSGKNGKLTNPYRRAQERTDLALEGYLQTTRIGSH